MRSEDVIRALQMRHARIQAELTQHQTRVSIAKAELDALEATIHLLTVEQAAAAPIDVVGMPSGSRASEAFV